MNRGSSGVWTAPGGPRGSTATPTTIGGVARVPSSGGICPTLTSPNSGVPPGQQSVGGPIRRACPASGAQWNVQVVRGKMTGRCLWNACKALSLGLLLMVLGAAMATIGYYADQLSVAQVVRGNHTVTVKNETRGFHLNNFSYAGPIVMGVGGFIVVAACVMTFEARDSAAKVVPARLKAIAGAGGCLSHHRSALGAGVGVVGGSSRRSAASQTPGGASAAAAAAAGAAGASAGGVGQPPNTEWDQQLGVFKTSPTDRRVLTAALQQFSRELGATAGVRTSPRASTNHLMPAQKTPLSRSPSAPLLCPGDSPGLVTIGMTSPSVSASPRPSLHACSRSPHLPHAVAGPGARMGLSRPGAYSLLSPAGLLKRHAVSVDESGPYSDFHKISKESLHGSQSSMAMDLHIPNDCPVTLRVRDTARRRILQRQRPIEAEEDHHAMTPLAGVPSTSTHYRGSHVGRRRSSNASDHVHHARKRRRDGPFLERAASTDARMSHELYHTAASAYTQRAACSQETVVYRHHDGSTTGICCSGHDRYTRRRHSKTHRNSCELRKQRSYSPKGCRDVGHTQTGGESHEPSSGNRSN